MIDHSQLKTILVRFIQTIYMDHHPYGTIPCMNKWHMQPNRERPVHINPSSNIFLCLAPLPLYVSTMNSRLTMPSPLRCHHRSFCATFLPNKNKNRIYMMMISLIYFLIQDAFFAGNYLRCLILPPFQIIRHPKNLGESKQSQV